MSLSKFFPCFQFRLEDNVNKLDYSNNILTEGFPHVWEYERTLEELNVSSTRINYLPPQLFYCQGLKILLANNNNLESIPEAFGSLRQLQQLNLSRNFISNVPDSIKSCKNLTHLDLSCNSLQKLPDAVTCLISLQELILNETYLEFLPANFGRLVNLRTVELRSNNLLSLPKSMQRLTNLQRLDIGCNEFTKIPEVVGELKQLRELWFDFNQIQSLPQQIGKLRELIHCETNGNCLRCLPTDIGNWVKVEVLSLTMNSLTNFPVSLGMLKSLVTLKCESNELVELPSCISKLENLEELVVSHNKLTCLPNTIGMLKKLRYLFADDNNLQKLPDEICSCSVLSVISVSQNKLSALPDNMGHLKNLKVLNIVQNNIALLPVSLLNLHNLNSLWISNNQSQPLISLQYTDILNKTYLTCFMLPQLKTNYDSKEFRYASQISERTSDKAAACTISKRRICFAEETTIVNSSPQTQHLLPSYHENGNSFVLLQNKDTELKIHTESCGNGEVKTENVDVVSDVNSKDFLMRSPTPYPKELRLMAKYVQANQPKPLNIGNDNNSNNRSISLETHILDSIQSKSNYNNNTYASRVLDSPKICEKNNFDGSGENKDSNVQYYTKQCQNKSIEEYNGKIHSALATNNHQQILVAKNSPRPPPYFIARCFTKKSIEDLTNYEFVRKQQEQHQVQLCKHLVENNILLPKNFTFVGGVNVEQNSSIQLDNENRGNLQSENNDGFENYYTSSEGYEVIEATTAASGNKSLNIVDVPETSNKFSKRKCHKSGTKWLFGAHKNPKVIQVNIDCESGRDFEIDILPNKEGIYVVSTVSKSDAPQFVYPLDKLLEVDGVDFTNISINKAREILENSRPPICIMLSRK